MFSIDVANRQQSLDFDGERLSRSAAAIVHDAKIVAGTLSIAGVDDATIHALNRQYLGHDCSTDVLSFVLERSDGYLEGEVVASSETALRAAVQFGWSADDELLLYVIHGTLHLIGYDDQDAESLAAMRAAEATYLSQFGVQPRAEPAAGAEAASASSPAD